MKRKGLEIAREKAIKILESIAEYMGKENMFDCSKSKKNNTRWYDLEDRLTEIIKRK